jgi:hypothetical protein
MIDLKHPAILLNETGDYQYRDRGSSGFSSKFQDPSSKIKIKIPKTWNLELGS